MNRSTALPPHLDQKKKVFVSIKPFLEPLGAAHSWAGPKSHPVCLSLESCPQSLGLENSLWPNNQGLTEEKMLIWKLPGVLKDQIFPLPPPNMGC